MKKFLKVLLWLVLTLAALLCALVLFLTVTEFRPAPVEELEITAAESGSLKIRAGEDLSLISWNIGYAGLGADSDFFMDGGQNVKSANEAKVESYLEGIDGYLASSGAEIVMLQEVDVNSARTYGIDQAQRLAMANSAHALNYSCAFVPFPWPPIGRVNSGLLTTTDYEIARAERISLPCPFSWPVSTANLKRCLLVSYLPVEGSDKQLVLINLHLEAYDDGEGKIAQTKQLRDFIESEYEKGNYVIAGGDFNQIFPGSLEYYPNIHPELWIPGRLDDSFLPRNCLWAYDCSAPTCRLLNRPYDPAEDETTQFYVIDGFIISPNVRLGGVETVDLGFENSDHNPVKLSVSLD